METLRALRPQNFLVEINSTFGRIIDDCPFKQIVSKFFLRSRRVLSSSGLFIYVPILAQAAKFNLVKF